LKGEKLVILDDVIINLTRFITAHPGGSEVLNENIGRDISKYYYGGYRMKNMKAYPHSL
jgi:cytochrome b involved in lipid metabolism